MDYRTRMYQAYVSTHFGYVGSLKPEEYKFLVPVYRKRFAPFLPKDKQAQICDLACGSGHFLYFLQQEGYANTCGIDISPEQVEQTQQMGVRNIVCGNILDFLKDKKETFDLISAHAIIAHFTKDELLTFFDLVYQALKPGGRFLVTTVNASSLFGAGMIYMDFTHEISFTPGSLAQVYRVCGFRNFQVVGEKPEVYDLRSLVRRVLWEIVAFILKGYFKIEKGFGRGMWTHATSILEPRMIAIGEK